MRDKNYTQKLVSAKVTRLWSSILSDIRSAMLGGHDVGRCRRLQHRIPTSVLLLAIY